MKNRFEICKICPLNLPSNPFYFLNLLFFRAISLCGPRSTPAQPTDFTSKTFRPDLERPTTRTHPTRQQFHLAGPKPQATAVLRPDLQLDFAWTRDVQMALQRPWAETWNSPQPTLTQPNGSFTWQVPSHKQQPPFALTCSWISLGPQMFK